jgi:hypothetical protein
MTQLFPITIQDAFSDATMAFLSDPERYRRRAFEIITMPIKSE